MQLQAAPYCRCAVPLIVAHEQVLIVALQAATLDATRAVLAVGAKDPARIERLRAALTAVGR